MIFGVDTAILKDPGHFFLGKKGNGRLRK